MSLHFACTDAVWWSSRELICNYLVQCVYKHSENWFCLHFLGTSMICQNHASYAFYTVVYKAESEYFLLNIA
jgi:hypothetical protein